MLKIIFCTILLALTSSAFAGSFLTHEKFVHLSREEQKKVVVAVMELIVEMEQKYKRDVKTSGFDPERFQRYTEFMRKVSHLLFPEAHAARNVRYGQYLNQLRRIVTENNKCIYAGWISEMKNGKCTHPTNANQQLRSLYQSESGCTGGPNQITCNPAIFGFKNVNQKTLFCVPAGVGFSDNSSRDCMVKALNPNEPGASSVEERINNMISGIVANPNDSNAVFDFLIKACVCDPSRTPQINRDYASKIRPHQTCFAILKMLSEFTPGCPVASQPMEPQQLQYLSHIRGLLTMDQIRMNEDPANPNGNNVRTFYLAGIEGLRRDNEEFRNAEASVCGGAPVNGSCPEKRKKRDGSCCPANQIPDQEGNQCVADPDGAGGLTVNDSTGNTPDGGSAGGGTNGATTGTNGSTPTELDEIVVTARPCNRATHEWIGEGDDSQCVPKCEEGQVRNPETNACEAGPQTCSDDRKKTDGSCCPENQITNPEKDQCIDRPAGDISITVTSTNKSDSTATINVTVTPSDYEKEKYFIIWFRKNHPSDTTTTPPTGYTPRSDESFQGDDTDQNDSADQEHNPDNQNKDDDNNNNSALDPGENERRMEENDDKTSMDVARDENQDYEVCARLIRKADNSREDSSCATVEKKPKAPVRPVNRRGNGGGMMNPFNQQQMPPSRGGSSDAIFRGVR